MYNVSTNILFIHCRNRSHGWCTLSLDYCQDSASYNVQCIYNHYFVSNIALRMLPCLCPPDHVLNIKGGRFSGDLLTSALAFCVRSLFFDTSTGEERVEVHSIFRTPCQKYWFKSFRYLQTRAYFPKTEIQICIMCAFEFCRFLSMLCLRCFRT